MALVKRNSKTTKKLVCDYKGYPIREVTTTYFRQSPWDCCYYDTTLIQSVYVGFEFGVKGGDVNNKSERYSYYAHSLDNVRETIDKIENGSFILLTEKEWYNWVGKPNAKNGWGFTSSMLLEIMRSYKKASPRRRVGYIERLHDANFHTEADLLEDEKYEEFEKYAVRL